MSRDAGLNSVSLKDSELRVFTEVKISYILLTSQASFSPALLSDDQIEPPRNVLIIIWLPPPPFNRQRTHQSSRVCILVKFVCKFLD